MSQEFDNNVLDQIKQKWFYTYEHMTHFETFQEKWPSKEKYYSSLTDRQNTGKEYEHVINVWNENSEKLSRLALKVWCFVISWCVWKILK